MLEVSSGSTFDLFKSFRRRWALGFIKTEGRKEGNIDPARFDDENRSVLTGFSPTFLCISWVHRVFIFEVPLLGSDTCSQLESLYFFLPEQSSFSSFSSDHDSPSSPPSSLFLSLPSQLSKDALPPRSYCSRPCLRPSVSLNIFSPISLARRRRADRLVPSLFLQLPSVLPSLKPSSLLLRAPLAPRTSTSESPTVACPSTLWSRERLSTGSSSSFLSRRVRSLLLYLGLPSIFESPPSMKVELWSVRGSALAVN